MDKLFGFWIVLRSVEDAKIEATEVRISMHKPHTDKSQLFNFQVTLKKSFFWLSLAQILNQSHNKLPEVEQLLSASVDQYIFLFDLH